MTSPIPPEIPDLGTASRCAPQASPLSGGTTRFCFQPLLRLLIASVILLAGGLGASFFRKEGSNLQRSVATVSENSENTEKNITPMNGDVSHPKPQLAAGEAKMGQVYSPPDFLKQDSLKQEQASKTDTAEKGGHFPHEKPSSKELTEFLPGTEVLPADAKTGQAKEKTTKPAPKPTGRAATPPTKPRGPVPLSTQAPPKAPPLLLKATPVVRDLQDAHLATFQYAENNRPKTEDVLVEEPLDPFLEIVSTNSQSNTETTETPKASPEPAFSVVVRRPLNQMSPRFPSQQDLQPLTASPDLEPF